MSINIIATEYGLAARTVCDECKATLEEQPATEHDHPGTTLLVGNLCRSCADKRGWPKTMDDLRKIKFHEVRGPSIANLSALAKVQITG